MRLYHGSNVNIHKIELAKCNLYKDFGQAFYLTEELEQALAVAKARAALFDGEPVINEYDFDESLLHEKRLSFYRFVGYTQEWADFVFKHRDYTINPPYMHSYDVVYGPIANDRVGVQIRNLRLGYIDIEEFMRRLKFMKGITFQWAFCTEKAINNLRKI